jgi:hypothetical protein
MDPNDKSLLNTLPCHLLLQIMLTLSILSLGERNVPSLFVCCDGDIILLVNPSEWHLKHTKQWKEHDNMRRGQSQNLCKVMNIITIKSRYI